MSLDRYSGTALDSRAHLQQSIGDILTTRIGTRLQRREYGSMLPELIDAPLNDATRLQACAAAVIALLRWEPRILLSRVQLLAGNEQGQASLEVDGFYADSNEPLNLRVPLALGATT